VYLAARVGSQHIRGVPRHTGNSHVPGKGSGISRYSTLLLGRLYLFIWFASQTTMSFLREELQRYSGNTSARAFASHVHRFRDFVDAEQPGRHSEAEWLRKIILHLDGSAAEYIENVSKDGSLPFGTVDELLLELIKIYSPTLRTFWA
jgi:hypothetical protein